jgi:drug/metabolite transporter (DMT)-like permease
MKGCTVSSFFMLSALSAALCFGIGDFLGGKASTKLPVVAVLVISELFGCVAFGVLAWINGESMLSLPLAIMAVVAGITGAVGLAGLYHGIAQGHTAVTAPVSAVLSAIIPVLFGIYTSGFPSTLAVIGMSIGTIAIVLNSLSGRASGYQGLWQGLLAGVTFGVFLILLKYIGSAGIFVPLAIARGGALLVTIPWLLTRPRASYPIAGVGLAIAAGTFDLSANAAYMVATQHGRLDIASMLASLYPAITVLLAFFVNGEKINTLQRWGLVATVVASVLISF